MTENSSVETLPLLPIKNTVLFPHLLMPFSVGRAASLAAVRAALATEEKEIVVVTQRDASVEEPGKADLFTIGTKAIIKKSQSKDDYLELIVQGVERVVLLKLLPQEGWQKARVRLAPVSIENSTEVEALRREVLELAARAHELSRSKAPIDFEDLLDQTEDPVRLAYLLGSMLNLELTKEQALLETATTPDALRFVYTHLRHELQVLELRNKIASAAQSEMTKQQREYVLRQQLRAIQEELGEDDAEKATSDHLRKRFQEADLPDDVRTEAEKELNRLERVPTASPEHGLIRTYLELVLDLPWRRASETTIDIARTRQVLDEDHYNLKEVKGRILEQLGVLKLNPGAKAPILCFVGPPGVGKTSLGQSIARSLDRKFERMSLGGVGDEAELRGHRRTYIGAMPGRVINALRRAGVNNPVMMLDEVDKLGRDFRGDPAAALLEVLDPEQNRSFRDNYLDLPFDLSKVLFITTANTLGSIPQPLLDRMEVLRLPGYSEEEKSEIAVRYLLPRQLRESGLDSERLKVPDETLKRVITRYTREAGVRQLERALGRLCRKVALGVAEGNTEPVVVQPADLHDMLGPEMVFLEQARATSPPGVVAGLAVTETGGDVLYVESSLLPGGSDLTLTGQLGEVMQESARAARSYVWAHARMLDIDPDAFKGAGVHIHVPAGAVPKDGPSAGVTMVTALASLYSGRAARTDTAMTGEITLTGLVLPVGGIKEKMLAARRTGFRRVILPKANAQELRDLPEHVRAEMEFVLVERIAEVLEATLAPPAPKSASTKPSPPRAPELPAPPLTKIARRGRGARATRVAPSCPP